MTQARSTLGMDNSGQGFDPCKVHWIWMSFAHENQEIKQNHLQIFVSFLFEVKGI